MRLRRGGNITVELETRIEEEAARADEFRRVAERTASELDALAQGEAAGEIDGDAAAAKVDELLALQRGAEAKASQRHRVVASLRDRLEDERRGERLAQFHAAEAERDKAAKAAVAASAELAELLEKAVAASAKLVAARAVVDEKQAAAVALVTDGVAVSLRPADEPSWPAGIPALLEVVKAGPRQPRATAEVALEASRRQSERNARARIAEAVDGVVRHGVDVKVSQVWRALDDAGRRRVLAEAEREFSKLDGEKRERGALVVAKLRDHLLPVAR